MLVKTLARVTAILLTTVNLNRHHFGLNLSKLHSMLKYTRCRGSAHHGYLATGYFKNLRIDFGSFTSISRRA